MRQTVKQYMRIDCYLGVYDTEELSNLTAAVNEIINKDKQFQDWLEAEADGNDIHLFGETEEELLYIPGCAGSYMEPVEPSEFDGMIELDELKAELKTMLTEANMMVHISEIDHDDTYVDDYEELMDKVYAKTYEE